MFDELLEANRKYAETFGLAGLQAQAAKGFALVTCMDTRLDPLTILGLQPGDAKIIRNAGGRITPDALRSLVLATHFLGVTEIAVVPHTLCALAHQTDEKLRDQLPPDAAQAVRDSGMEFLAMPDPDATLAADVAIVRECAAIAPGVRVEGWRYRVEDGLIDRIIPA